MRNMSFALTTEQVRRQEKTVTRRIGWATLKPGTPIQPVVKGMGLKKGETAQRIGGPIRVVKVDREPLSAINEAVRQVGEWFRLEGELDTVCLDLARGDVGAVA